MSPRPSVDALRADPDAGARCVAFIETQLARLAAAVDPRDRRMRRRRVRRAWRALRPTVERHAGWQVRERNMREGWTRVDGLKSALQQAGFDVASAPPSAAEERRWLARATRPRPGRPATATAARFLGFRAWGYQTAAVIAVGEGAFWIWEAGRIEGCAALTGVDGASARVLPHELVLTGAEGSLRATGHVVWEPRAPPARPSAGAPAPGPDDRRLAADAVAWRRGATRGESMSAVWDAEPESLALALILLVDPDDRSDHAASLVEALDGLGELARVDARLRDPETLARLPAVKAVAAELVRFGEVDGAHVDALVAWCARGEGAEALARRRALAGTRALGREVERVRSRLRWDYEIVADDDGVLALHGTSGSYDRGQTVRFHGVRALSMQARFSHPAFTVAERADGPVIAVDTESGSSSSVGLWVACERVETDDPPPDAPDDPGDDAEVPDALRALARARRPASCPTPTLPEPRPSAPARGLLALALDGDPTWRSALAAVSRRARGAPGERAAALDALADGLPTLDDAPAPFGDAALVAVLLAGLDGIEPPDGGGPLDAWLAGVGPAVAAARRRSAASLLADVAACCPGHAEICAAGVASLAAPEPPDALRRRAGVEASIAAVRHALGAEPLSLELPEDTSGPGQVLADPAAEAGLSEPERVARAVRVALAGSLGPIDAIDALPDPVARERARRAAALLAGLSGERARLADALVARGSIDRSEVALILTGDAAARLARVLRAVVFGHPGLRVRSARSPR